MTGRDGAGLLLSAATCLLPFARREWGRAMRAELTGLSGRRDRWSFALGCAATVLREPIVLRSLAYSVLTAWVLAWVVVWSAGIAYATLRWGIVALVGVLVAVSWLGRIAGPVGPVGATRTARAVRGGGSVLVGVAALGVITALASPDWQPQDAQIAAPFLTAMLACYLAGFVAVTADRSSANARMLHTATGAAAGGALLWLAAVVLSPPIPETIGPALEILAAVIGAAAYLTRGQLAQRGLAALTTGTVMTLLLLIETVLLANYAPARLIPDLAPAALTPADDLAQSRAEVQDPYVAMLLIGALIALALTITSIAQRRRATRSTA